MSFRSTDGWKRPTYYGIGSSGHVARPVMADAEGGQMPIIRYSTGQNRESYVVKTERVIRHIVPVVNLVAECRYSTEPGKEEVFWDEGVDRQYTHVTTAYDRPEKVEEILTKVLSEASQPIKAALPLSSACHSGPKAPNRPGHDGINRYGDDRGFEGSDTNKLIRNSSWGKQNEPYLQTYRGTNHMNYNKDGYNKYGDDVDSKGSDRNQAYGNPTWGKQNEPYLQTYKETNPMNYKKDGNKKYGDDGDFNGSDRNKAYGNPTWGEQNEPYLQNYEGLNPMNRNKDAYDFYDRPKGNGGSNVPSRILSKPTNNIDSAMEFLTEGIKPKYGNKEEFNSNMQNECRQSPKVVPLSTNRWRTSSKLPGQESKIESNENDLEKQNQHARCEKPQVVNDGKPSVVQTKFPSPQKKEINSHPETIDSREASRRYGKSSSPSMSEEEYEGTINSREAVVKYNGVLVPR